ncbi:50S ribosomal protein L24 [Candidatus Gottesmanbacteria bacterium]|nr:50S ribosomal protein L24 [Candidatus Gottesmanbacteria bacterium]
MKIKKGDTIIITAGKDKGKKGKIEKVFADEAKVLVPGLNIYKRHTKKRDEKTPGGIVEFARPLPMGNVAVVCPSCKKPTRVGFLVTKEEKYRVCRKCGAKI